MRRQVTANGLQRQQGGRGACTPLHARQPHISLRYISAKRTIMATRARNVLKLPDRCENRQRILGSGSGSGAAAAAAQQRQHGAVRAALVAGEQPAGACPDDAAVGGCCQGNQLYSPVTETGASRTAACTLHAPTPLHLLVHQKEDDHGGDCNRSLQFLQFLAAVVGVVILYLMYQKMK